MNNIKLKTLLVLSLAFFFISGAIRHDVPINKYFALAQQPQFDCVGKIISDGNLFGSCVLITPKHILSAAHIFTEVDITPDTIYLGKDTMLVVYNTSNPRKADIKNFQFCFMDHKDQLYQGVKLTFHPTYLNSDNKTDLAIIELDREVTNLTPAKLNADFGELHAEVVGVGYGMIYLADKPKKQLYKRSEKKIAGENTIDSLGGFLEPNSNQYSSLYADFDHPTNKQCCNKMGNVIPLPLEFFATAGHSGGGLFEQDNEQWKLIGITAGGGVNIDELFKNGYYGRVNKWTRVSVSGEWINENIK
ncbi:MAG: trypsin-like serine protease [Bacteroidetes bacterium]|nr:trypsin-like serine protease [Bacteroidota bacterium]